MVKFLLDILKIEIIQIAYKFTCSQGIEISTTSLQSKWIDSIDPLLHVYFTLPKREEFGFDKGLSLIEKLKIMSLRLELLAQRESKIPFEVEAGESLQNTMTFVGSGLRTDWNSATITQGPFSAPSSSSSCITSALRSSTPYGVRQKRRYLDMSPTDSSDDMQQIIKVKIVIP